MARYAAFLRGINVSGRRITNADLRAAFAQIGFEGVATFRASGNVVFDASGDRPAALAARIEEGLGETLGYPVPAFVRTGAQVRAIAEQRPFDERLVDASAGKLQVLMLARAPQPAARKRVLALASERDRLAIAGSELYWLPSGGIMESELDLDAIGEVLGPTTMRTKGTVEQIAKRFFG